MSKCNKCNKVVKDGIECCVCECLIHPKCLGLSDDASHSLANITNFKFFCDCCLKLGDGFKLLNKVGDLTQDLKKISDNTNEMKSDLSDLKKAINVCSDKFEKIAKVDDSIKDLKNEMTVSWASVVSREVKKNVDVVTDEVLSIRKSIGAETERKDKENNIVLFNLAESENWSKDREVVMTLLQDIAGHSVKEPDVIKIIRQGRKDSNVTRPVIIKFVNSFTKSLVMTNLTKLRSLDDKFSKVRVTNDLTREQRVELNKLIADAKSKEANSNGNFLFRVRGPVGRWKIVKIERKKQSL